MEIENLPRHNVLCVDMKSFYASCEAVYRGLDPLEVKLVVVGDINRDGSVVLAASPQMKKIYNIKTGSRLFEVKKIKDPDIIIAQARMEYYLNTSKRIQNIFLKFVPPNSLHQYSVDESWLTIDGTFRLWGDARNTAKLIIEKIKTETGCIATVGIGQNKFQAKFCLDVYGKHKGIAECNYENFQKLFHHLPVKEMWGIGDGIAKRLNRLNIHTVGDIAKTNPDTLKKEFGVIGLQLYEYSWGIDYSPVFYDENNPPPSAFGFFNNDVPSDNLKSIGRGVTLLRDYIKREDIILVIRELLEEVCEQLRKKNLQGRTVHLSVGYSRNTNKKGFSRQFSFKELYSNDPEDFIQTCVELLDKNHSTGPAVRTLRVAISKLQEEQPELLEEPSKSKRKKIINTMDLINDKFGKGAIRPAFSYKIESISRDRNNKIGGHYKGSSEQ